MSKWLEFLLFQAVFKNKAIGWKSWPGMRGLGHKAVHVATRRPSDVEVASSTVHLRVRGCGNETSHNRVAAAPLPFNDQILDMVRDAFNQGSVHVTATFKIIFWAPSDAKISHISLINHQVRRRRPIWHHSRLQSCKYAAQPLFVTSLELTKHITQKNPDVLIAINDILPILGSFEADPQMCLKHIHSASRVCYASCQSRYCWDIVID